MYMYAIGYVYIYKYRRYPQKKHIGVSIQIREQTPGDPKSLGEVPESLRHPQM